MDTPASDAWCACLHHRASLLLPGHLRRLAERHHDEGPGPAVRREPPDHREDHSPGTRRALLGARPPPLLWHDPPTPTACPFRSLCLKPVPLPLSPAQLGPRLPYAPLATWRPAHHAMVSPNLCACSTTIAEDNRLRASHVSRSRGGRSRGLDCPSWVLAGVAISQHPAIVLGIDPLLEMLVS